MGLKTSLSLSVHPFPLSGWMIPLWTSLHECWQFYQITICRTLLFTFECSMHCDDCSSFLSFFYYRMVRTPTCLWRFGLLSSVEVHHCFMGCIWLYWIYGMYGKSRATAHLFRIVRQLNSERTLNLNLSTGIFLYFHLNFGSIKFPILINFINIYYE